MHHGDVTREIAKGPLALRKRIAASEIPSSQLSDHFPIWLQVKTDIDCQRLNQIVQNGQKK